MSWQILTHREQADGRWIASDKSTRIPLSTFRVALELHNVDVDADEVECMVANMIYRVSCATTTARQVIAYMKGFMKGYISHEKQMVVLAKIMPFPNLTTIAR